jgi:membrane associated rhomboid family serine protease
VKAAQQTQRPLKSRLGFAAAAGPPRVTYTLIALNVAFYLYGLAINPNWLNDWALVPILTEHEPWRLVTSAFAHASIFHIGMNMFVLWQLGSILEPALGRVRFGILYAASALGGSMAVQFLAEPTRGTVGASGAILGLIAAYVIVLRTLKLPYRGAAIWAGALVVAGFVIPVISWQGHLGGAVAGAIVMTAMFRGVNRRSQA